MKVLILLAVLAVIGMFLLWVAAHVANKVMRFLKHFTLLKRFLAGHPMDGSARHDGTFLQAPTKALHPTAARSWWHWRPGWHRSAMRLGALALVLLTGAGMAFARTVTEDTLMAAAAAGFLVLTWHVAYRIRNFRHERHYVRPLERTLTAAVTAAPVSLEVERDGDAVKSVAIEWPPEAEIGTPEQDQVLHAVTARLAMEAPDAAWKLKGRSRSVVFTQSEPPPSHVEWADVEAAVLGAAANELVFGVGKRGAISKAAYSESPHIAIPGGSGGGKSNLAAFLLIQEMLRGSLIFNLDPKWISHLWLQDLPNVINAHEDYDLHLALAWLGKELLRRTKAAYYSAEGTGRVRGSVGPRIIVLCEELNYGMPGLKDYWNEILAQDKKLPKEDRDPGLPKKSPAIGGLSAMSCAGRASDIHEWLIAQLLTVESTGVKDSTIRTNAGIKAMARHDPPGWGMAVGKHVPMPPPSTAPGRIHLVTGDGVRETQVPYLHLDDKDEDVAEAAVRWARELVLSGTVAQIPSGPEGVPPELWPASAMSQNAGLSLVPAQGPETVGHGTGGPVMVSLRKAVAEETLRFAGRDPLGAARKASQRPGFPEAAAWDGKTALYYRSELREWQDGKVRVLR